MDANEQVTLREAYAAMFRYLERVYSSTGRPGELGALLGSMALLPDGQTADTAAWSDWLDAVHEVKEGRVNLDLSLSRDRD